MTVVARRMWTLFEAVHAVTYFAPEALSAASGAGYRGFWMGYFACRMAPLGAVGPQVATSACFGFHRSRAERALPDAWSYAGPERALAVRVEGATAALRPLIERAGLGAGLAEAADLAWQAAAVAECGGRVLGAANQALPRPDDPLATLWQACTTLREHRGDSHNCVLIADGVSAAAAHWIKIAAGETAGDALRSSRNWPDEEWRRGRQDLVDRGWIDAEGALTAAGSAGHADLERRTDEASASAWTGLGATATQRLAGLLSPLADAIAGSGVIPFPNPVGLPLTS